MNFKQKLSSSKPLLYSTQLTILRLHICNKKSVNPLSLNIWHFPMPTFPTFFRVLYYIKSP